MEQIIGVITAPGDSRNIPLKNLHLVAGKPLIVWTIEAALQSSCLNRVIVSTDDARIAKISRQWGAEVPFLGLAELSRDDTPQVNVLLHALDRLCEHGSRPDRIMTLPPTSPLRTSDDIDATVRLARQRNAEAVVSVTVAPSHPLLCMRVGDNGRLEPYVDSGSADLRRQNLPEAYAANGAIYLNTVRSLQDTHRLCPPDVVAYEMPAWRSLRIESTWDLTLADMILEAGGQRRVA